MHCFKKPKGQQNCAVNWKYGQGFCEVTLKVVLSWEVHMHTYTHMQKLLAKKKALGRSCIKLPHFMGCCGNKWALWKCKTTFESNAKNHPYHESEEQLGLRKCKLTCQTVARQSEPGAVWRKKKGGWGLGKTTKHCQQSQQNGPAVHSYHNKKIQRIPGTRIKLAERWNF